MPTSAKATTRLILELVESHRTRVHALGRSAPSAARVFELVAREIVLTIPRAAKELELSQPTVGKAATRLQRLGILDEVTGRYRNKIYVYSDHLALLTEGTEVS